jgi:hypothetical protein
MNLWATLGLSPPVGLLAVVAGMAAACVLAVTLVHRRSRVRRQGLGLTAHR